MAVSGALTFGSAHVQPPADWFMMVLATAPSMLLALVLARHPRGRAVANALGLLAASVSTVAAVEAWGASARSARPWPAAAFMAAVAAGVWVWNLTGFVALCLVFPDGWPPGAAWRRLPPFLTFVGVATNAFLAVDPSNYGDGPRAIPGRPPELWPPLVQNLLVGLCLVSVLAGLASCVACLVSRYRRGDDVTRIQLRWLLLGVGAVPVLLAGAWVAILLSVPTTVAVSPFFLALTLGVPAVVTVAVVRYDLFDIDRLLSSSVSAVLTAVVTAVIFTVVVVASTRIVSATSSSYLVAATLVAAMLLLPTYRLLEPVVGRVLDRDRTFVSGRIGSFLAEVRDGRAEPEAVEPLLRALLDDPGLRIVLTTPGHPEEGWRDLTGALEASPDSEGVPLLSRGAVVGRLQLSRRSARRDRRARSAVTQAWLPIEMSRLRMELRRAVVDLRASRSRLAEASLAERRRLERDLHDVAQQHLVSVGMRLRSTQARLPVESQESADLDWAVAALTQVVADLRGLAHGLRPGRLDDGLAMALRELASTCTQPVELNLSDVDVSDVVAETLYYVVSEGLANASKHAPGAPVAVELTNRDGSIVVTVHDQGLGGAGQGFGLSSLRDRVAAVDGTVLLSSPPGAGTCLRVDIPTATTPQEA